MGEISSTLFLNVAIYLSVPFIFGYLCKKIRLSPMIGYIIGGVFLGNFAGGLISREVINGFASFGILLLLFTIGLEVNFEKLIVLKKFIITGGLLQIALTILSVSVLSLVFGFSFIQAVLIGIALASSSTALVAKIIQERGEESSFSGELALGILMLQDIAFIPSILIFTLFQTQATSFLVVTKNVIGGILEATILLVIMYYIGKRWVPALFGRISKLSRELLNLFIILFIFVIGYVSTLFHIPILIGMFMAGIVVSQTMEHYHIFSQVRPFRDVLAIIFFVYIGTHISLPGILPILPSILVFSTLLIIVKLVVLITILVYMRFSSRLAFSLAVFLFQVSENAFILLSLGHQNKVFTNEQYLLLITSVLISLIITPILINHREHLYLKLRAFLKKYLPAVEKFVVHKVDFDRSPIDVIDIKNHVIICGYGRIGSHIGRALMLSNIPFIAIDYNFHTVAKAKRAGVPIIYGDPTDADILDYAQVERAVVLVSVIPEKSTQEAIILNAKKQNKDLLIITRVHREEHQQRMKDLGAHIVVQPELEASLSIIKKLFVMHKIPKEEMVKKLRHFKIEQGI